MMGAPGLDSETGATRRVILLVSGFLEMSVNLAMRLYLLSPPM